MPSSSTQSLLPPVSPVRFVGSEEDGRRNDAPSTGGKQMPQYVIERQYLAPVYQHVRVDAPDLETACREAIEHDDWEDSKEDYENSRETTIVCAVEIPAGYN